MESMLSTKAFEQWLDEQSKIIVRYRQVEKSELLAEYNNLKSVVESEDFQTKKKELTTTQYADTEEGKVMAKYNALKWKKEVMLAQWLKMAKYNELPEVVEYLELQKQIETPAFKEANAFWKNPKRWFTTPESQQEKRFNALAKHSDILFYQAHTEAEVAELESYKMAWSEEFDSNQMGAVWQTGFLYSNAALQANHSHVNEQQAYTRGNNTQVGNSVMVLQTKKEKTTAPAWHPTKGMLMHPFAYTSDVWHTAQAVAPKAGVLQAKVACKGAAKHVLCLTKGNAPKALHILNNEQLLKGYAIYTLVWNEKEVITYINNKEVGRSANPFAGEALHVLLRSYLPENQTANAGKLIIDWIRIYSK